MGLSSASLPVDEERPVKAIEDVVNQRKCTMRKHLVLGALLVEDCAEFEFTRLFRLLNVKGYPLGELFVPRLFKADTSQVLLSSPAVL
jgi:hypothetical protein